MNQHFQLTKCGWFITLLVSISSLANLTFSAWFSSSWTVIMSVLSVIILCPFLFFDSTNRQWISWGKKYPVFKGQDRKWLIFAFNKLNTFKFQKTPFNIFFCFRPRKMMSIFVFTVAVTILFTSVNSALIHKSKVSLRHPVDIWWYSNYLPSMTDASNFILRKMTLACMDKMPGCSSLPRNLVFANILW